MCLCIYICVCVRLRAGMIFHPIYAKRTTMSTNEHSARKNKKRGNERKRRRIDSTPPANDHNKRRAMSVANTDAAAAAPTPTLDGMGQFMNDPQFMDMMQKVMSSTNMKQIMEGMAATVPANADRDMEVDEDGGGGGDQETPFDVEKTMQMLQQFIGPITQSMQTHMQSPATQPGDPPGPH